MVLRHLLAPVAELVDALDSKSSSARSAGSIPARGTKTFSHHVSSCPIQSHKGLNSFGFWAFQHPVVSHGTPWHSTEAQASDGIRDGIFGSRFSDTVTNREYGVRAMALTDTAIRKAKPTDRQYKMADSGGLYLLVHPRGSRYWRFDYRIAGKRKTMALGTYPDVSLATARQKRDEARQALALDIDPMKAPGQGNPTASVVAEPTFGSLAEEYIERLVQQNRTLKTVDKNRWHLQKLASDLTDKPIRCVTPADVLRVIKKIEASGRVETSHRVRAAIGSVFRFAISTLRAENDPTFALRGALLPINSKPQSAIIEEREFGSLLASIDEYDGWVTLRAALQLMALCYPRPIELRLAEWSDIDLEGRQWHIPASRTKMRRPHDIPLSRQAREILLQVKKFSGDGRLVFPSIRNQARPLSENAMNSALRRMGYTKDEHTSHGFRASASSILNRRRFHPDVIEASLAHLDPNEVRRTYNRYAYWEERVEMAQKWADICDELKSVKKSRRHDDLI